MSTPNNTPENDTAPDKDIDLVGIERSETLLENLFNGEVKPVTSDKEEEEEDIEEEEEVDTDEEGEDEEEAEGSDETDWEEEEEEEEKEEEPKNESAARKQAKIKGREAKQFKAQLTERELELETLRREKEDLAARVQEIEAVKLRPEDHPEYRDLRNEVISDVRDAADLLPIADPSLFISAFPDIITEYLTMTSLEGAQRTEAHTNLKGLIVDKLKLSEIPYSELDDEERRQHSTAVNEALKIVQRNVGKTKELQKMHAKLSEKAKNGQLAVGVRSYESTVKEFQPVLDAVGDLPDDVIEASPFTVEAVVAKLVKTSPKAAQRLVKARADVLEAIVGPRALSQAEIDKLEANGTDLKAFMAERQKAHKTKQQKLAAYFVQGLMVRTLVKEMASKLAKYEGEKDDEEDEFDAVRKATKKKAKVTEKPTRPRDRTSPLVSILGFDADD